MIRNFILTIRIFLIWIFLIRNFFLNGTSFRQNFFLMIRLLSDDSKLPSEFSANISVTNRTCLISKLPKLLWSCSY